MTKKIEKQPHGTSSVLQCEAKTRQSIPCKRIRTLGKKRCYMHGGAPGSGAPKGNKNAFKNGCYTKEALAERKKNKILSQ
jgi:hypothetical protein